MPCSYSRESLAKVIESGKSVILNGQHILDVKDLPCEADLAKGDMPRLEAALQDAQAKKIAAEAELAEVRAKLAEVRAKLAEAHKPTASEPCSDPKPQDDDPPKSPPFTVGKRKGGE